MKSSVRRIILEKICEFGMITADAFFPKKYPWAALSRPLFGLDSHSHVSRDTISSTLSRLVREGLVRRSGARVNARWRITREGKRWLADRPAKIERTLPQQDGIVRLAVFDIPERERKKRDRLRVELVACGFTPLQKSVWIGERPLPQEFIEFLDELDLKNKVHLFSVRERGTLPNK